MALYPMQQLNPGSQNKMWLFQHWTEMISLLWAVHGMFQQMANESSTSKIASLLEESLSERKLDRQKAGEEAEEADKKHMAEFHPVSASW